MHFTNSIQAIIWGYRCSHLERLSPHLYNGHASQPDRSTDFTAASQTGPSIDYCVFWVRQGTPFKIQPFSETYLLKQQSLSNSPNYYHEWTRFDFELTRSGNQILDSEGKNDFQRYAVIQRINCNIHLGYIFTQMHNIVRMFLFGQFAKRAITNITVVTNGLGAFIVIFIARLKETGGEENLEGHCYLRGTCLKERQECGGYLNLDATQCEVASYRFERSFQFKTEIVSLRRLRLCSINSRECDRCNSTWVVTWFDSPKYIFVSIW